LKNLSIHLRAVLLAVLVTFIWSTSWIFIKIGLKEIPPLTFAGLRYFFAFLCLLPFLFQKENLNQVKHFHKNDWIKLTILGVVSYSFAQGFQYLGLALLSTVTVGLLLNLSSLFVVFSGMIVLQERPTKLQWVGVAINLLGIFVYFMPVGFQNGGWLGFVFVGISLAANIAGAIQGRAVNRSEKYNVLVVTVISMGIGSTIMLGSGLILQGLPKISLTSWGIVVLLAVLNTAFAFTAWNYVQRILPAMESSFINSTNIVQIALLSWIFLGEKLTGREIFGLALTVIGVLIVQINVRPTIQKNS
jgi:drug/metabolite transporter (DMT)-like permease